MRALRVDSQSGRYLSFAEREETALLKAHERETAEWVRWFNADRLPSSIDYLPPIDYETRYRERCPIATSVSEVA